jgi:hypothetical protein
MKTAKHTDPVMQELWASKDANAARFGDLTAYVAHLRAAGTAAKSRAARLQRSASKRRATLNVT